MRTTLDLDDDVLQAAKEIASTRGQSAGRVVSDLVRKALQPDADKRPRTRNGVPLLGRRAGSHPVTMALVNRLRDV
jgi:hypothetical protein